MTKVQRINTSDTGSLFRWQQEALFALYSWNASPIDVTDISRSLVAIGREFPFPTNIEGEVDTHGHLVPDKPCDVTTTMFHPTYLLA
jgi:hypothetical protein